MVATKSSEEVTTVKKSWLHGRVNPITREIEQSLNLRHETAFACVMPETWEPPRE